MSSFAGNLMEPVDDVTGCSIVLAPSDDWVALIRRGGCSFVDKVHNMQQSGAIAVLVGDPEPSKYATFMTAPDGYNISDIQIPSGFVKKNGYEQLLRFTSRTTPLLVQIHCNRFWLSVALFLCVVFSVLWMISLRRFMRYLYSSGAGQYGQKTMDKDSIERLEIRLYNPAHNDDGVDECAICLENYLSGAALRVLPCNHHFHAACVDAWLMTRRYVCPICKRPALVEVCPKAREHVLPMFVEPHLVAPALAPRRSSDRP
ncbi:hypothetical protein BCR43DRAFT_511268 [Syncephalastrum racemosum]|uniref:RING-type domain-containing protein n=1 Tax=Syncephalastrum racemosum TaxID=13706 RepID=A0A1X2HLK2_SYNRA|nr:hypothetical protein BCR43DRAFT_511268 [Syncephalastrum racemosum]